MLNICVLDELEILLNLSEGALKAYEEYLDRKNKGYDPDTINSQKIVYISKINELRQYFRKLNFLDDLKDDSILLL